MNDPKKTIDRAIRFLESQKEMYGSFSIQAEPAGGDGQADRKSGAYGAGQEENKRNTHTGDTGARQEDRTARPQETVSQSDEAAQHVEEAHADEGAHPEKTTPSEAATDSSDSEQTDDARPANDPASQPHDPLQACRSLEELRQLCEHLDVLETDMQDTNLVFGVGNPDADLMLIGEAPGYHEDQQQEPFVGKAGQLLDKILAAIHFDRSQVYIANILKHRPPNNRDPKPEERMNSLPYLFRQIDLIQPKLIVCLGRVSAHTLLNTEAPMKELRGEFHRFRDSYELMVTYHPAALLRNPNLKRPTWEDVQKLRARYDELGCKP